MNALFGSLVRENTFGRVSLQDEDFFVYFISIVIMLNNVHLIKILERIWNLTWRMPLSSQMLLLQMTCVHQTFLTSCFKSTRHHCFVNEMLFQVLLLGTWKSMCVSSTILLQAVLEIKKKTIFQLFVRWLYAYFTSCKFFCNTYSII